MQVSGIGAAGVGGASALSGGAATTAGSSAAGVPAANSTAGSEQSASLDGTFLEGTVPAGLEALSDTVKDLTARNLLFTLIILALLEKGDKDGSAGAAVVGFLAGLSLASQLSQASGSPANQSVPGIDSGLGGQLDLQV